MDYCQEQETYIRDKVKVILDLSNFTTNKELKIVAVADTSNLAHNFIALKADVHKLDVDELVNVKST